MTGSADFLEELEIFRKEEETAQQLFYAYLALRDVPAHEQAVSAKLNETPLFWTTTHYATLLASFVVLGRIFDQAGQSDHTIDRLIGSLDVPMFAKSALFERKLGTGMLTREQAVAFVAGAYEPTAIDFRRLRWEVGQWRRVYEQRYRDVRDKVFAHKSSSAVTQELLARTSVEEIQQLLAFLAGLHAALLGLYHDGLKPVVTIRTFAIPPSLNDSGLSPGARVYSEAHRVLRVFTAHNE